MPCQETLEMFSVIVFDLDLAEVRCGGGGWWRVVEGGVRKAL